MYTDVFWGLFGENYFLHKSYCVLFKNLLREQVKCQYLEITKVKLKAELEQRKFRTEPIWTGNMKWSHPDASGDDFQEVKRFRAQ